MPKIVLLIGSGAREHAIAEAITRSANLVTFAKATNPGIKLLSREYALGKLTDTTALEAFVKKTKPNLAIIGPEDPLVAGVADFLNGLGVPTVGPSKKCAQLEGSKSFTRELVTKYNIPGNPRFETVKSIEQAKQFMELVKGSFVVKTDGLKGGKGVKVVGDHLRGIEDGLRFVKECLEETGKVVVEEKLIGQEFSLMSFVDGETVVDMPAVQDHKRAFDGDQGPNTGGMGSYSDANHSLPFLIEKDLKDAHEINVAIARAVTKETGESYKGILYGGFMVTKNGVRLIEYNVRFGDPEAMNVLPILETNFVEICEAIVNGTLAKLTVKFAKKATVCKYLVPEGYPDHPVSNKKIDVAAVQNFEPLQTRIYYASVDQKEDGLYLSSSRALAFVGIADTIQGAEKIAESAVSSVKGPVFYRKDIGTAALINRRVKMMQELRDK